MSRGSPREEFGPYLVYEQLGAGGMAEVHRAEQAGIEGFRKVVALKRMLPHMAANEEMVKSFVREARLASYLRHANVAQTYDLGKVDNTYFIAMELIEGRNLRDVLRRCAGLQKRLPVPFALNILNQICDALDYAHNLRDHDGNPLGIIHRDVSPSNVIVAADGVVKLIDFGIAKASAAGMQTMSGVIKGKYGYMAPEYLAGRLDARADLFAVGVIAHELLTNRPLFTTNDDLETLQRVRGMVIEPPSRRNPAVPAEIDDIVMTALERDPDQRWQHATALRSALTTLTKRLGMQVMNKDVVEWLDVLDFESSTLPYQGDSPGGDSVMISVERETQAATHDMPLTVLLGGEPIIPPPATPIGTPAHTITAQRSIPPKELEVDAEYHEAKRRYDSHAEHSPPPLDPATAAHPTIVEVSAAEVMAHAAQRLSAQQPALPTTSRKGAPGTSTRLTAVLLVLLAAAVAVAAVYFLMPLMT